MRNRFRICQAAVWVGLLAAARGPAAAEDWPGWRGPRRDGICQETGLLRQWPEGGPKLAWKATGLGEGYSGPAIVGSLLFTMGSRQGQQWVLALDWTKGGKTVWETPLGTVRHDGGGYAGPRATPTLDGDRLYTLGIAGELVCLDVRRGEILWRRDLVRDFGGQAPGWGYSESVLVDGPWVVCTPGGPRATIAALLKSNGRPVWTSPVGDPAAYSSILPVSIGKVKQYVQFTAKGVIGVSARDGKLLWRYDRPANGTANVSTPVWLGQTVFAASDYGVGGGLVWVKKAGQGFRADEMYSTKQMKNHHGGLILLDDYLYGADDGTLTCLQYKTGKVAWTDRTSGKCSLLCADGMLYARNENGPVSLVEATPEGFRLQGRFHQPERSNKNSWPHPVIAHGRLYLRDQDVLLCYDIRAGGE